MDESVGGCMNQRTDKWLERPEDGWTDRWMDGRMGGWVFGWMNRRMDGWTDDRQTDIQIDEQKTRYFKFFKHRKKEKNPFSYSLVTI